MELKRKTISLASCQVSTAGLCFCALAAFTSCCMRPRRYFLFIAVLQALACRNGVQQRSKRAAPSLPKHWQRKHGHWMRASYNLARKQIAGAVHVHVVSVMT